MTKYLGYFLRTFVAKIFQKQPNLVTLTDKYDIFNHGRDPRRKPYLL